MGPYSLECRLYAPTLGLASYPIGDFSVTIATITIMPPSQASGEEISLLLEKIIFLK